MSAGVVLSMCENGNDIIRTSIPGAVMLDEKTLILGTDIHGAMGKKLVLHPYNETLIPEGVVQLHCVVPSLHFNLVSVGDAGDGTG